MLRRRLDRHLRTAKRLRRVCVERLEPRQLLAAVPLGATPVDTGEFLLGTVAVTPVFFESNGLVDPESQDWTADEIDQTLARIVEGVNWWSDLLDTFGSVHSLEFEFDNTFAITPFETGYEPIDRPSGHFEYYVSEFLDSQGYGNADSIEEGVHRFNHGQRLAMGTDWAFTIFVVDSSVGDGYFASGFSGAFAYAGGLFVVFPSTRPASTVAHEMGHIFWAKDEYSGGSSWTDRRGYYDAQNWNAADNTTPGFVQEDSIMRSGGPLSTAYFNHISPESTLAMVGWRDSDSDGIFDVLDVPLDLQASGYFDPTSSTYFFSGTASAVPLLNQNSSGSQSDITLNRVSEIQYRLDGGPWVTAATPDQQAVDFDLAVVISQPFSSIQWRAIDNGIGVTSQIISGTPVTPAIPDASITGIAFLDVDGNGTRDMAEPALAGTQLMVRNQDGSSLFSGLVDATETGFINFVPGVAFSVVGDLAGDEVQALQFPELGNQYVFQYKQLVGGSWTGGWTKDAAFQAMFDNPMGEVSLRVIGLEADSYARIEAYDAEGNLIRRVSSDAIHPGVSVWLRIADAEGRISSVRAYGHGNTEAAFDRLEFGFSDVAVTDASGAIRLQNLPDGTYRVDVVPQLLIHQFAQSSFEVTVAGGASSFFSAAARPVDSPRHNSWLPEDVNEDGDVTASDALVVINDLGRSGARILGADEVLGDLIDVNNDGRSTAFDALLVINRIAARFGTPVESEMAAFVEPALPPSVVAVDQVITDLSATSENWLDYDGSDEASKSISYAEADSWEEPSFPNTQVTIGRQIASFGGREGEGEVVLIVETSPKPNVDHPEMEANSIFLNSWNHLRLDQV